MTGSALRVAAVCALCPLIVGAGVGPCVINTVAGSGTVQPGEPTPADLTSISGPLSVGPSGAIYFTGMTQVFKLTAGVVYTVGGSPQTTVSSGDGGPATQAHFTQIGTIMVGPDESIYVSDAARIRKITPDGIINTIAGTGLAGFSGDGGPATSARVQTASGLALDSLGKPSVVRRSQRRRARKGRRRERTADRVIGWADDLVLWVWVSLWRTPSTSPASRARAIAASESVSPVHQTPPRSRKFKSYGRGRK